MFKLNSSFEALYGVLPAFGRDCAASAYAWWSGKKKYGGSFAQWRRFLSESQWWNLEQLRDYQQERVAELLAFAHNECSFFRDFFDRKGLDPRAARPLELLQCFPIIDRAVVREHYNGIKTRFARDPKLTLTTSGTTGASLHVPHTGEALQREYAFRWQYYSMGGAARGEKFALFQGQMVVPLSQRRPPFFIRNFAERTIMFSLYHMDDTSMHAYVEALNDFEPAYFYGYPSGLFVLAAFIKAHGLRVIKPKAIFTASEMLHEFQKEVIQDAFQAPIFQWYGQVESTVNLQECDRHRLHVKEEYGLLELVADDGTPAQPGQIGQVIATGWGNKAFPLIRYNTGDNMVLDPDQHCPCGRGGRIIQSIAGRDDNFIVTPEGRYVGRLDFVFKAVNTVKESQLIQEDEKNITIRLVPASGYSAKDEGVIVQKLKDRIGTSMQITVEKVDRIPRGGGGKFRYVVSKVKHRYSNMTGRENPGAQK